VAVILLSQPQNLAGMDGNRTHPGRLSSAPQTVLKTAGLPSARLRQGPHKFGHQRQHSMLVRIRPQSSAGLAVFLAVSEADREATLEPGVFFTITRLGA